MNDKVNDSLDRRLLRAQRKARQAEAYWRLQVDNLRLQKTPKATKAREGFASRVCGAANAAAQAEILRFRLRAFGRIKKEDATALRKAFREAGEDVPAEVKSIEEDLR